MLEKCLSSHLMTHLLTWRNPQGSEENWYHAGEGRELFTANAVNVAKAIAAEAGIVVLGVAAATETVAFTALSLVSFTFLIYTDRPLKTFIRALQSSSFTVLWCCADAGFSNLFFKNVFTEESIVRFYTQEAFGTNFFYRSIDRVRISELRPLNPRVEPEPEPAPIPVPVRPAPAPAPRPAPRPEIRREPDPILMPIYRERLQVRDRRGQGADLLREIARGQSPETRDLCREFDPEAFLFMLTKAVYVYACGSRRNDIIPNFFKEDTIVNIQILRADFFNGMPQDVINALESPQSFERGVESDASKAAFRRLRFAAAEELQHGFLITGCWQQAFA